MINRSIVSLLLHILVLQFFAFNAYSEQLDELYVLYDAGETNILRKQIETSVRKGRTVKALVMGTASDILKKEKYVVNISDIVDVNISRSSWSRERKISNKMIKKITAAMKSRVVITGMVSEIQRQIAESFSGESRTIGVFDSFNFMKENYIQQKFSKIVDEVWVPSSLQVQSFNEHGFNNVYEIGHSSFDEWKFEAHNKKNNKIAVELGLGKEKKPVLYVGGYGQGYIESFQFFLESIVKRTDVKIVISLHPKSDGLEERELLKNYSEIDIVIADKKYSTAAISSQCDYIVTQNSTAGVLALAQGKNAIYFHTNTNYKNIAISSGLAQQFSSASQLNEYLDRGIYIGYKTQVDKLKILLSDSVKSTEQRLELEGRGRLSCQGAIKFMLR